MSARAKGKISVVIPARMASSRFPNKPLTPIAGLPMIEHVRRRACLARGVDEVIVATCDQAIVDVVERAGGRAVLTSDHHERATGRVAEAMRTADRDDIICIVQGDEPLLLPEEIERMIEPFLSEHSPECVSMLSPLTTDADYGTPNIVKAACDQRGYVLFFSRAPIPFFQRPGPCPVYRETGLRAFRADFLRTYGAWPETPFERVESVDLMRVLEHGHRIFGVVTTTPTFGVDHAADVAIAEDMLRADPEQRALHRQILAAV